MFLRETIRLGVCTSRIFISGWVLEGDSGFSSDLDFFLVDTISNAWSSLYDPLHAIVLCYCTWIVTVSETYSHYRCRYIMLDPLRLINVANHTYQTLIVYWIVMKNKSSELTRLYWVGIRPNQFGMFEERFKLLSRWKQCGFKFETKGCLKTMNK